MFRAKDVNDSRLITDMNDDCSTNRETNKTSVSSKRANNCLTTVSLPTYNSHGRTSVCEPAYGAHISDPTALHRPVAVHSSRRAFIDKQRRIYGNCFVDTEQSNCGSSSIVNPDGDGEKKGDLQPPKAKSFVISDEYYCGSSSEYATTVESDGDVEFDFDYEHSVTDNESSLRNQAQNLEYFISDPEETTRLNRWNVERRRKRRLRRGFFNIPGEFHTCRYRSEEGTKSDWVIITIELERTESCDSSLNEELIQLIEGSASGNSTPSGDSVQPPSQSDSNLPSIDENYGLIYVRNSFLRRILQCLRIFDFNIKFGQPLPDELNHRLARQAIPTESELLHRIRETNLGIDHHQQVLNYQINSYFRSQEPCCSKNMDLEMDKMATFFFGGSKSDIESKSTIDQLKNQSDATCIAKYFGLNDDGDIIIHYDHIVEQKGYGFLMKRKRNIYRRVGFAQEMFETDILPSPPVASFFTRFLRLLCKFIKNIQIQVRDCCVISSFFRRLI